MRRNIIPVLQVIAVTGSLLMGAASSAQDDPVAATHREAMTHYAAGRVSQAIATLEKSLPSPRNEARLQGRLPSVTLLVDVCTRATDWDCLAKWALPALTLTLKMPADNELQRVEWQRQAGYYYAVLAAIQETPEAARQGLADGLEAVPDDPLVADKYVDRKLLAAYLHLTLDDRVNARLALERALATLLSALNAAEYRWFLATRLVGALSMLASLGDIDRAFGLYLVSGDFLAQSFAPTTVDYVGFRLMEAQLLQMVHNLPGALNAVQQARTAMDTIEVSPATQYRLNFRIDLELAYIALLAGDPAAADAALHRLEKAIDVKRLARRGQPLGSGEISVLTIRALHRLAAGQPRDDELAELLARGLDPALQPAAARQFDIYRRFGALAALQSPDSSSFAAAREVARDYVSFLVERARFSFEVFPRPTSVDRLLASSLVQVIAHAPVLDNGDAELLLQLTDIATRSARSFDSEALALLGLAATQEQRQLLHQGLRLASRRNKHEQEELRRLMHAASTPEPPKGYLQTEYGRRIVFADFFTRIEQTRAHFAVANPTVNTDSVIPRLADLQGALRPNEAVLKVVPLSSTALLSICVTSSGAESIRSDADIGTADGDARLLTLSLTASHGPDDRLDAQYPAISANRLYRTLFEPTDSCTRDKRLVFWLMSQAVMPVPVAALLKSMPTAVGEGYDLAGADWLVKSTAIAMLETPQTLVALRSNRQFASVPTRRLLGVGDPLLAGLTSDGQRRGDSVRRSSVRNANGDIASLAPLPDSRDELRAAIAAVGAPSTLLVGEDATEAQFRREPLSQYRYLSFATHGLIREEIPGLREAALVLTPSTTKDTFDDGLLTASELADLPFGADFVALSACNTANFDLAAFSVDVPGLATAFAIAGVPATLATLWPVDSMTSGRVVAEVFAQLGRSPELHPALALAQAQRHYLAQLPGQSYAHPRFWAPFIVLGDSNYAQLADSAISKAQVAVEGLRIQTSAGGEILAASTDGRGGVIASAIAEWNGERYAGSVMRFSPDGELLWKKDRYDIGAGKVASPSGDGALVAGYRIPVVPTQDLSVELGLMDGNGKWTAHRAEERPGVTLYPSGAVVLPDGTQVIALSMTSTTVEDSNPSPSAQRALLINRYSQRLEPLGGVELPLVNGVVATHTSLFTAGPEVYLAVVDPVYSRQFAEYQDVLQNRRGCSARPQTWLYVLDAQTLATKRTVWIADSSISGFFAGADGAVFAVGAETECDGSTRLVLWKIAGESLEVAFRDESLLSTLGGHGIRLADGRVLLVGVSERVTDIDRHEQRVLNPEKYAQFTPSVSFSTKRTRDLLVLVFSPRGVLLERSVVPFGGDVYVNGLLRTGWGLSAYGAVAGQGSLIDLKMRTSD